MSIDDKKYTVYIHINKINNKCYVGITCRDVYERWGNNGRNYLQKKNGVYSQEKFARAIEKYGWDSFEHIIWASGLTHDDACKAEKMLIWFWDTVKNGYNITSGGEGMLGYVPSEETRKKLSISLTGRDAPNKGMSMSDEQKKLLSELRRGIKLSEEHKEKIGKGLKSAYDSHKRVPYDRSGTKNPRVRRVAQYTTEGTLIKIWDYIKQAAEDLGISRTSIVQCCNEKYRRKTAGGYIWKYI